MISYGLSRPFQSNKNLETRERDTVWWNSKLGKLRETVRRLCNKAKANNEWDQYKSNPTEYHKEICNAKRDSCKKFCEWLTDSVVCARIHKVLAMEEIRSSFSKRMATLKTAKKSLNLLMKAHIFATATQE